MGNSVIIDVREKDEFASEHIEHSINIPLSMFNSMAPGIFNQLTEKQIIIMCRSGVRSAQAQTMALGLGFNDAHSYEIYPGGILRWKQEGKPVVKQSKTTVLPIMRQVQLIVGAMVLIFSMLALFVHPYFAYGAAFFGAGLFLAGASGFCLLANLLAKMPWNRA